MRDRPRGTFGTTEREDLINEFRGAFDTLAEEHPMVGDVRGDGCFYSVELVKDKETKATFTERDVAISSPWSGAREELRCSQTPRGDDRRRDGAEPPRR